MEFAYPFSDEEKRFGKSTFVRTIYDLKGSTDNLYIDFEIFSFPHKTHRRIALFGLIVGPADDPNMVNPDFEKIYSLYPHEPNKVIEQHLFLYQNFGDEIRIKETDPCPREVWREVTYLPVILSKTLNLG